MAHICQLLRCTALRGPLCEMIHHVPFNYRYFLSHASAIGGRILDYGCGRGEVVAMGESAALTSGAQIHIQAITCPRSMRWRMRLAATSGRYSDRALISRMPTSTWCCPIRSSSTSPNPRSVIAEMGRLLRRGGTLIAAFPVTSTWYEGHVGLYFAHRVPRGSVRHAAFVAAHHRLGFGLYRADSDRLGMGVGVGADA